jgi:hypothetical protein
MGFFDFFSRVQNPSTAKPSDAKTLAAVELLKMVLISSGHPDKAQKLDALMQEAAVISNVVTIAKS